MSASPGEIIPTRILIISANPLFSKGLEIILGKKWKTHPVNIRRVTEMQAAFACLADWRPELIVLDYDDETIDCQKFLQGFVTGAAPAQLAIVSLQDSDTVIVYDRKLISPSEPGNWLTDPKTE